MPGKKYSFGQASLMKAIEPGQKAMIKFLEKPKAVDTEWGQKYSFPIILISHDSYDSLPIKCNWESKSMVAKEVFEVFNKGDNKEFIKAYEKSEWQLTRFDTGAYWLDQI